MMATHIKTTKTVSVPVRCVHCEQTFKFLVLIAPQPDRTLAGICPGCQTKKIRRKP